jgi:tetratricopeptide (TPR) repeat protein
MDMTNTEQWRTCFNSAVVANADYWRGVLQSPQAQRAMPPDVYANVLQAILAALELEQAWPGGSALARIFHDLVKRQGLYWSKWMLCLARWARQSQARREPATQARALMYMGEIHERRGEWAVAEGHFQTALELFENGKDVTGEGRALVNLGMLCRRLLRYDLAESYCQRALDLFTELDDLQGTAMVHNNLGTIYRDQGKTTPALEQFTLAYDAYHQLGESYSLADVSSNIGVVYRRLGSLQEAVQYLAQAIELYRETGDTLRQAVVRMNLGNVYLELSQTELAERCYLQAEGELRKSPGSLEQAQVQHNLGLVYIHKRYWEQALACLERAVEVWRGLGQARGLVNSLDSLGEMWMKKGDRDQAQRVLQEALRELEQAPPSPAMEELGRLVHERLRELG